MFIDQFRRHGAKQSQEEPFEKRVFENRENYRPSIDDRKDLNPIERSLLHEIEDVIEMTDALRTVMARQEMLDDEDVKGVRKFLNLHKSSFDLFMMVVQHGQENDPDKKVTSFPPEELASIQQNGNEALLRLENLLVAHEEMRAQPPQQTAGYE